MRKGVSATTFVCGSMLAGAMLLICYLLACVWIDPFNLYHTLSPERYISIEGRYSKVAMARASPFDSYIAGSSISEEFDPAEIEQLWGVKMGNLTLGGATSYEQLQILRQLPDRPYKLLFMEVFFENYGKDVSKTFPGYPAVLYDGRRVNDIRVYLQLNKWILRELYHALLWNWAGRDHDPDWLRLGFSGYFKWESRRIWDAERVRKNMRRSWVFHERKLELSTENFKRLLETQVPRFERVYLYFPPVHAEALQFMFVSPRWNNLDTYTAWKKDIIRLAAQYPSVVLLDYETVNSHTKEDAHFWTFNHTRAPLRRMILEDFASWAANRRLANPDIAHVADADYGRTYALELQ